MYDYQKEKPKLFTESGFKTLMEVRDTALKLLGTSGAFTCEKVISGDSWLCLAALDYLVETGKLRRLTPKGSVMGQREVFVKA